MRYLFGFLCVCALGLMPLMGCSETAGDGGSGGSAGSGGTGGSGGIGGDGGTGGMPECQSPEDCDDGNECTEDTCADGTCDYTLVNGTSCGDGAGTCQAGSCVGTFACTEEGILDAIAVGGGPHTFDCGVPTTVGTDAEIVIDNDVILDGEGNLTVDGNQAHRVFSLATNITAELRGLTVTGGASEDGGGIYNAGVLALTNSTVSGNAAEVGGAILTFGTMTLTNSTVSGNTAEGFLGGGISNGRGTLTLTNSIVSGNAASRDGGIFNDGTMTLTNSTVSGNTATFGSGGIFNLGVATLTNSTVSGNSGEQGGGIGNNGSATPGTGVLVLNNVTVSGNTASQSGGGIGNQVSGTLTLTNSTVSGNTATTTGGGILTFGTMTLTNGTVSGNEAPQAQGIWNTSRGTLTITKTVIEGDCITEIEATTTSNGYNIESPGDTCGFDQSTDKTGVLDPMLGPLQDNGGPTETHALGEGSVAIDVIPAEDCVDADGLPLTEDQRGFTRPVAILGPEPKCDVGAFEVQP